MTAGNRPTGSRETSGGEAPPPVSVVVPAYQEAEHVVDEIEAVRAALDRSGRTYEIVVVDDGSTDGTGERAASTGVRVVTNPRNMGYGAALKRGVDAAAHDRILIVDADGTYPADAIEAVLAAADDVDMVVGARTGESVHHSWSRRPAKWFLRVLAGYLVGTTIPDLNSGLRLMRRSLVERYRHLLPSGFSFTTTITLAALSNDHAVTWIPIDYRARLGDSKIRARHTFDFFLLVVRTIVFFNPLKVFLPMGAVLALAGLAKFVYDVWIGNLSESAVLAFLAGLIVWSVGLLADQNARIAMHR